MAHLLIVEDEDRIAQFIAKGFRADGHVTTVAADGVSGLDLALSGGIDLMILDIGLPGMDGFAVLDQLRSQGGSLPVIVLTARDSVTDTVHALDGGADDYLAKPFKFAELRARVHLRLRQAEQMASARTPDSEVIEAGAVQVNLRTRKVVVDGVEHELSSREFALVETFVRHPGQVLTREVLLDRVWGFDFDPGSNVVDVYVGYLRKKLGGQRIQTVRGAGYRFTG